ncbi:hypothetical protein E4U32_003789 [Claviceps aff. humidiphila group G2b]|nr:hypothetical protein E4U32_003789 [Claviceps aff. humidiphila group G2b]
MSGILARQQYLIKLSRALIMCGAPPYQLEEYMSMSSRALEIEARPVLLRWNWFKCRKGWISGGSRTFTTFSWTLLTK